MVSMPVDTGLVKLAGLHRVFRAGLGGLRPASATARPGGLLLFLVFTRAHRLGIGALLLHQRLAVGDGDLVIIGMNFRKRQEAVTVAAVIDKGRLQRRLDPGYLCEVDVASKLALVFGLKVKFLNLVSVHHHDAGFLRVGGVDEHFLSHVVHLHATRSAGRRGAPRFVRSVFFWQLKTRGTAGPQSPPLVLSMVSRASSRFFSSAAGISFGARS